MKASKVVCYEIPEELSFKSLIVGQNKGDGRGDIKLVIVDTKFSSAEAYINVDSKTLLEALKKLQEED